MTADPAAPAAVLDAPRSRGFSAPVVLAVFVATHVILNTDKSILHVLTEPIKHEYGLSDSAMGFLNGAGFAVCFALAGFPLGRWVDRGERRSILAGCIAVFSLMTGTAAFTVNYLQLLLTRVGVAVGEAGGGPAMLSMISDLFDPRRRATAIGIYYLGVPLGLFLTFWLGSQVAAEHGWRAAFLVATAPGLLVAAIIAIGVREPARARFETAQKLEAPPLRAALAEMWRQQSLRQALIGMTLTACTAAGLITWLVSVLIRSHGFTLAQAGTLTSIAFGVSGAVGTVAGGWIVDRLARRDVRWRAWWCCGSLLIAAPLFMGVLLAGDRALAAGLLVVWALFNSAIYGPVMGMCQSLVQARLRGTLTAVYMFCTSFIGVSVGAQIVGVGSDLLRPLVGESSLRDAMLILTCLYLWAATHFFLAGRTLGADLARVARSDASQA
jgi:predicted MFS family arabinose efflux permease